MRLIKLLNQPIVKHVPKRTEADFIIKRDTLNILEKIAGHLPKFDIIKVIHK